MSQIKDPARIKELIKKAEHEDWTMDMLANLIGHSRDCTSYMCLRMNATQSLDCSCGVGIDGAPVKVAPTAAPSVETVQIVEPRRRSVAVSASAVVAPPIPEEVKAELQEKRRQVRNVQRAIERNENREINMGEAWALIREAVMGKPAAPVCLHGGVFRGETCGKCGEKVL